MSFQTRSKDSDMSQVETRSKTLEMVDLTMALFARFHVNGSWKDIVSLFS